MDNDSLLIQCLQLWDQAGQRPYEVLIEEDVYDFFLDVLDHASYNLEDNPISEYLYRGTSKNNIEIGTIITYDHPSSWSESYEVAERFIIPPGKNPIRTILCLTSETPLRAIYNFENSYEESEVIVAPIRLEIFDKDIDEENNILVYVRPIV
jgi:hypothetical protein